MTVILPSPIQLVQGRYGYREFDFLDANGAGLDISLWQIYCDTKYAASDTAAIFTQTTEASPPSIIKDPDIQGRIKLTWLGPELDDVDMPADSTLDFPYRQVVSEVYYINGDGEKISAFMFRSHIYERVGGS